MKKVKIYEEFIVAVFGNDELSQRSEEKLPDRHLQGRILCAYYSPWET